MHLVSEKLISLMKSKATAAKIEKFIRVKVKEAGRQGTVVGVSGGLDSAVCLYLAANSLDKDNIYPVFLPVRSNNKLKGRVKNFCSALGVKLKTYDLSDIVGLYRKKAAPATKMQAGNFTARLRTAFLYSEAESRASLVINTSNLSETMVGYFTKWGDEAGDISPIGGLYKTEVYTLAEYLKVPGQIISAAPTAGFFKRQTDEGELGMNYDKLDGILRALKKGSCKEYGEAEVARVKTMVNKSAHKRDEISVPDLERE